MIIPYEIGTTYFGITKYNKDNQYRISGITVKSDSTIKIRLTPVPNQYGVFEVTEEEFIKGYREA